MERTGTKLVDSAIPVGTASHGLREVLFTRWTTSALQSARSTAPRIAVCSTRTGATTSGIPTIQRTWLKCADYLADHEGGSTRRR